MECVFDALGFGFQSQQAFAAGPLGQPHEQGDQVAIGGHFLAEGDAENLAQLGDALQRERNDDGADRAAEDDHRRRQVHQREENADAARLDDSRPKDGDQREAEANRRALVHG